MDITDELCSVPHSMSTANVCYRAADEIRRLRSIAAGLRAEVETFRRLADISLVQLVDAELR